MYCKNVETEHLAEKYVSFQQVYLHEHLNWHFWIDFDENEAKSSPNYS